MHNCQHGMVDEPILELQYLASSGVVCMKRGIASNLVNFRLTIAYVLYNSQIMKQSCRKIKNVKFHYLVSQPQQQSLYLKFDRPTPLLASVLNPFPYNDKISLGHKLFIICPMYQFNSLPSPTLPIELDKKVCQVLQSYSKKVLNFF